MTGKPLTPTYLEQMRAHVDEGGTLSHRNGLDLLAEVERLTTSPITKWDGAEPLGRAELARRLQWVAVQVAGLPDKLPRASMNVLDQAVTTLARSPQETTEPSNGK